MLFIFSYSKFHSLPKLLNCHLQVISSNQALKLYTCTNILHLLHPLHNNFTLIIHIQISISAYNSKSSFQSLCKAIRTFSPQYNTLFTVNPILLEPNLNLLSISLIHARTRRTTRSKSNCNRWFAHECMVLTRADETTDRGELSA